MTGFGETSGRWANGTPGLSHQLPTSRRSHQLSFTHYLFCLLHRWQLAGRFKTNVQNIRYTKKGRWSIDQRPFYSNLETTLLHFRHQLFLLRIGIFVERIQRRLNLGALQDFVESLTDRIAYPLVRDQLRFIYTEGQQV